MNPSEAALARVKRRVKPRQFQILDLYVLKQWPVKEVARALDVSRAQVYVPKHRMAALLKQKIRRLQAALREAVNGMRRQRRSTDGNGGDERSGLSPGRRAIGLRRTMSLAPVNKSERLEEGQVSYSVFGETAGRWRGGV
jgi:hypothetical protein